MRHILSALAVSAALAGPAVAGDAAAPVVVELFTSQGCSACRPANVLAGELAERGDVIMLTYGVDYWNYLGWRDTFAEDAFAERQHGYAARLQNRRPYTPQMVVDGHVDRAGFRAAQVRTAIEHCAEHVGVTPAVSATRAGDEAVVDVGEGASHAGDADIWLVGYDPGETTVSITSGENAGTDMAHYNVVRSLTRIGGWDGPALSTSAAVDPSLAYVVLVQEPDTGAILSSARVVDGGAL